MDLVVGSERVFTALEDRLGWVEEWSKMLVGDEEEEEEVSGGKSEVYGVVSGSVLKCVVSGAVA